MGSTPTGSIQKGQTAGIGFWNNKNGQALILAFNGGGTSRLSPATARHPPCTPGVTGRGGDQQTNFGTTTMEVAPRGEVADDPPVAWPADPSLPPTVTGDGLMQSPRPLRVLVVDDNPDVADTLGLLVRGWGHEALVAYDGARALGLAMAHPPDVVLLDVVLPDLDGHELARRLRGDQRTRQALLVALSGLADEEDRQRCLEAGCDLHLVKPVDLAQLKALLDAASRITSP